MSDEDFPDIFDEMTGEKIKIPENMSKGVYIRKLDDLPYKNESDMPQMCILLNEYTNKNENIFYVYIFQADPCNIDDRGRLCKTYADFVIWYSRKEIGKNIMVMGKLDPGDSVTNKDIDDFVKKVEQRNKSTDKQKGDKENGQDDDY